VRRSLIVVCVVLALLVPAWSGRAFDPLLPKLARSGQLTAIFGTSDSRARVRDGFLVGLGTEHTELRSDGVFVVTRVRTYTSAIHPQTGKRAALPEPWHVRSTLEVSAGLRLLRVETTLELHKSADRALGYPLSEKLEELFAWNRGVMRAIASGKKLDRTLYRDGHLTSHASFDYAEQAVPLDIVSIVLSAAIKRRIDNFDFQLLLPDGATHGVRSVVHRTRDLRRFQRGYRLQPGRFATPDDELAVADLSLASPVKHLFYPHHFYFVYAAHDPATLLAVWGGDPDAPLTAFREP